MLNARVVAIVFAALSVVLGIVVFIQARMLLSRGWTVQWEWGNLAEWVAAVGTFAAFGALYLAARQWSTDQIERRDRRADQARLISFEPKSVLKAGPGEPPEQQALVHNQSALGIIDLIVMHLGADGQIVGDGRTTYPYLRSGQQSHPIPLTEGVQADTQTARNYYAMNFTDAAGQRWCRVGRQQPVLAKSSPIGRHIDQRQDWLTPDEQVEQEST